MAITTVGKNRVYASINDLPQNQTLVDGDRILIQTDDGTALVDYQNIKIELAHTTFETQFSNMVNFTAQVTSFMEQMEEQFSTIQEDTNQVKVTVNELAEKMECVKLMLKFIMGSVDNATKNDITNEVESTLTGQGLIMYNECIEAMEKAGVSDYQFNMYNLRA